MFLLYKHKCNHQNLFLTTFLNNFTSFEDLQPVALQRHTLQPPNLPTFEGNTSLVGESLLDHQVALLNKIYPSPNHGHSQHSFHSKKETLQEKPPLAATGKTISVS